ncbi:hypothetical protein ACEQ8H_000939 [Pleosporales sp. CAS-2024a]
MLGLIELPSELLYQIICLVDSSPYASNPDQKRYRPARLQSRAVVCFPTTDPTWPSHTRNLLFVCKRLHYETSIYLEKAPQDFELDLAIVNNHWLWPTWKYIPSTKLGHILDKVHVNVIQCRNEDERENPADDGTLGWDTTLEIMKVIGHFLRSGTSSASFEGSSMPRRGSNFRVKTIIINFDTNRFGNGNEELSKQQVPFRKVQGLGHLTFDSLYAIDTATRRDSLQRLAVVMKSGIPRQDDGLTICERVPLILFKANGIVQTELHNAQRLSRQEDERIADYLQR